MMVILNGTQESFDDGACLEEILARKGILRPDRPVAVLLNERVVPSSARSAVRLAEGDRVEIVSFQGGG